jgi:hypothetical protein
MTTKRAILHVTVFVVGIGMKVVTIASVMHWLEGCVRR